VKASTESIRPSSVTDARLSAVDEKLNAGPSRIDRDRRDRGWREAEVLVSFRPPAFPEFKLNVQSNQLSNEESVEAIIRKRSLDGESLPPLDFYQVLTTSFQIKMSILLASTDRYSRKDMVGSSG
jgi:hypothetical protein